MLTGVPAAEEEAPPPPPYGDLGIPPCETWCALNGDCGGIPGRCLVGIVAKVTLRVLKAWFRFWADAGLGREASGGTSADDGRLVGVVSD